MIIYNHITLAITGASGVQYGLRLLRCLVKKGYKIYFLISKAAQVVISTETDLLLPHTSRKVQIFLTEYCNAKKGQIHVFNKHDWMSPPASGSSAQGPMVICPCSTGTLSAIANGSCNNLIERAADVILKERKLLILVVRETPLSIIHIKNMLFLSQNGAIILPASPGFYHKPKSIDDLINFIVARILNILNINQNLLPYWGDNKLFHE